MPRFVKMLSAELLKNLAEVVNQEIVCIWRERQQRKYFKVNTLEEENVMLLQYLVPIRNILLCGIGDSEEKKLFCLYDEQLKKLAKVGNQESPSLLRKTTRNHLKVKTLREENLMSNILLYY